MCVIQTHGQRQPTSTPGGGGEEESAERRCLKHTAMKTASEMTVDALILVTTSVFALVGLSHIAAMWILREEFGIALRYGGCPEGCCASTSTGIEHKQVSFTCTCVWFVPI